MPHYTTWGGTYVTRPVEIEDRDYSDNDWDINDFVIESTQVDGITGIKSAAQGIRSEAAGATYRTDNLGSTSGPGGTTYRTGEDDNIIVHPQYRPVDGGKVINGPLYQPEADGVIQRGDIYQDKAQLMLHAPKESEYRPEAQVNPVGVGYTEVEWTYFANNLGGTGGTGGTNIRIENVAGFPYDSFGFESSTFDVMNVTLSPASNSEYA